MPEPRTMSTPPPVTVSHYDSPLGAMTLACDGSSLIGLWFDGQKHDRATAGPEAVEDPQQPVLLSARAWLDTYFSGTEPGQAPPVRVEGSPFRQLVCRVMRSIPFGATMTYGQVAAEVARLSGRERVSARAVGGAVGRNPISLIIPCHRVVGSGGSLTGYAGGTDRKRRLLELEGADVSGLFVPTRGTAL